MNNAVITLCIGEKYKKLSEITHPSLKAYAAKINSDFIVIDKRIYSDEISVGYEKLQLRNYLDIYDRIIFLDSDVIVRPDTPNLFDFVPEGMFGAFNEGEWLPERLESLKRSQNDFGLSAPDFKNKYFNTGVFVFDRSHKNLFVDPPKFIDHFYEQTYLNIMLARTKAEIRFLPCKFNRMSHLDANKNTKDFRLESCIVHYAGISQLLGWEVFLDTIKKDLEWWEKNKPNYHVKKIIKVSVGGGLGDQISAEPVVREIRRLYPKDHIIVASHWPEVFKDLEYEVESVDIRKHKLIEEPYAVFNTYAGPETEAWKYMTHVFSHSTDFSSQLAIRRILPPEKKSIQIKYTPQDLCNVLSKFEKSLPTGLEKTVCIHPGRSWRTKTMSSEFWNGVIKNVVDLGIKTIIVGKDSKDMQGLVPIKLPDSMLIEDFRNKLSIKETLALLDHCFALISNDSAPIHIAGATDTWILGIYTAKHPSFVLPFRKGVQNHKTIELNNRPSCWPCNVDACTTSLDEVRADYCTNFDNKYNCFPSIEEVINKLRIFFNDNNIINQKY